MTTPPTAASILLLAVCACVVGGMLTALQAPTNAMLARPFNSPVNAAFVSFAVGTLVLLVAIVALRVRPDWSGVQALPWHAWLGGAYGRQSQPDLRRPRSGGRQAPGAAGDHVRGQDHHLW
jgi:hypothetical protein